MKSKSLLAIPLLSASLACGLLAAQAPAAPQGPNGLAPMASPTANPDPSSAILDWTPPALKQLESQAAAKSSFTFDRSMLSAFAGLISGSDDQLKQAVARIDGVSAHLLRFGPAGIPAPEQVQAIREAYRRLGWKHVVTTTENGSPLRNGTTDVWFALDGSNVRGAVVLAETPRSLSLVTVAGNLSPLDLLHLRGHFGIPKFDADDFKPARN